MRATLAFPPLPESKSPADRSSLLSLDRELTVISHSYWKRLIRDGGPGALQRFMSTMDLFFQAITIQAKDRREGVIPDLDSYIAVRRDTSGCKPCWALIEYANGLDILDEVMEHPAVEALGEAANDLVTWSNVSPPPPDDQFHSCSQQADDRTSSPIIANKSRATHTT